jgi:hypothetical protein
MCIRGFANSVNHPATSADGVFGRGNRLEAR